MENKMKDWERTLQELGEHWTGSPVQLAQARIAVCQLCTEHSVWFKDDDENPILNTGLEDDVRHEMMVLMLERLEKFEPERVSLQTLDGTQITSPLLKYVLSCQKQCYLDAMSTVKRGDNVDRAESVTQLKKGRMAIMKNTVRLEDKSGITVDDDKDGIAFTEIISDQKVNPDFLENLPKTAATMLCAVAGVILNFCNAPGSGRNTVLSRWFMPMCFSEHMAYITENDRGEILLRQRLMAQYHKNVLNALDWNYLRFFADGLPEQPDTLSSLYKLSMKLASEVFPDGEDKPLRFRGESFFLEAKVPIAYYAACTGETKQDSFVTGQRKRYAELLVQLRPE